MEDLRICNPKRGEIAYQLVFFAQKKMWVRRRWPRMQHFCGVFLLGAIKRIISGVFGRRNNHSRYSGYRQNCREGCSSEERYSCGHDIPCYGNVHFVIDILIYADTHYTERLKLKLAVLNGSSLREN